MAEKIELKVGQVWVPDYPKSQAFARVIRKIDPMFVVGDMIDCSSGCNRMWYLRKFRAWIRRHNARVQP